MQTRHEVIDNFSYSKPMWRLIVKKIAQVLMTCVMAAVFMVIMFSLATAAEVQKGPATGLQKAGTINLPTMMCPAGWHQKKHTSEEFKCAPNKPAPVTCPAGWKFVEAYDCQGSAGLGSQIICNGCEVGCLKIPVIK
jgi:hypothetical protein